VRNGRSTVPPNTERVHTIWVTKVIPPTSDRPTGPQKRSDSIEAHLSAPRSIQRCSSLTDSATYEVRCWSPRVTRFEHPQLVSTSALTCVTNGSSSLMTPSATAQRSSLLVTLSPKQTRTSLDCSSSGDSCNRNSRVSLSMTLNNMTGTSLDVRTATRCISTDRTNCCTADRFNVSRATVNSPGISVARH
jgi:hypothetical protein